MTFFKFLWGFDFIVALIAVYFFIDGLNTASNSGSFTMSWLMVFIVFAVVLGGSMALKNHEQFVLSKLLLAVIAVPALLYGLWILAMLIIQPKWQ